MIHNNSLFQRFVFSKHSSYLYTSSKNHPSIQKRIIMQNIHKFLGLIAVTSIAVSCGTTNTASTTSSSKSGESITIQKSYMSNKVSAKEDFFMFANESWVKNNPIPNSESRWGSFNELDQANKKKLTVILEEAKNANAPKGSDKQILGDYYASFLNTESRDKLSISPLKMELEKINNLSSKSQILEVAAMLHSQGVGTAFGFGVGQDMKSVDNHITYFGQGGIGLPNKDYYFDEKKEDIREAYRYFMTSIFNLAKIENPDVSASIAYKIEHQLASEMLTPAEMRSPEKTYNKFAKQDFIKDSKIDFNKYLIGLNYPQFDTLIVSHPPFAQKVGQLIDEMDVSVWKSYFTWCLLNHYAGHLSNDFTKENFRFYQGVLSGKIEMKPMNDQAIEEITQMNFGEILGKSFVEKHFSVSDKDRVNEMVDNLLAVYANRINGLEWMTSETKKEALNKLNSIGRKLGFPSKWESFTELNFGRDTYIANVKQVLMLEVKRNIADLNKKVDKQKWEMPAHMVNAYYHPLLNEIAFPAGIMQAPFFDSKAEDAVNYGSIGMVIGHEFTHGFDDKGSKFAADGSFKNWWSEADRKAFEEKTEVLGETFSSFCPIEGHCINKDLTMGENIADLGGLTMAYYAYTMTPEFRSGMKREGFTPAQRFFIAYAQLWKINYTDQEMKKRIATDSHSPGMYRVNGPLKNCPEFFEAFDIKEGDAMRNPEAKVARIW